MPLVWHWKGSENAGRFAPNLRASNEEWQRISRDGTLNIKWISRLGSESYGNPVIANGQIYVGTNNAQGYLQRFPARVDLGCLLCFEEATGDFLWQLSRPKLPAGRVHDWPQ